MAEISLNLVVLRSPDLDQAEAFYLKLGLCFTRHRHGKGPEHLATEMPGGVFEIYPESENGASTRGTRVGFAVKGLDEIVGRLGESVISQPKDSPWGRRAVVSDPDGHRVELVERQDG